MDHEHDWELVETGYSRRWATQVLEGEGVIIATSNGGDDFSESGAGDEHLECLGCGAVRKIPDGLEVQWD